MGYGLNGKHNLNRWERGDRGITSACLLRYLSAIDASLIELHHELSDAPDRSQRLLEIAHDLRSLAKKPRG